MQQSEWAHNFVTGVHKYRTTVTLFMHGEDKFPLTTEIATKSAVNFTCKEVPWQPIFIYCTIKRSVLHNRVCIIHSAEIQHKRHWVIHRRDTCQFVGVSAVTKGETKCPHSHQGL